MLEAELVKRDRIIQQGEWINKDLADSLMVRTKERNDLQEKNYWENHKKKQWRRLAGIEAGMLFLIIGTITTLLQ